MKNKEITVEIDGKSITVKDSDIGAIVEPGLYVANKPFRILLEWAMLGPAIIFLIGPIICILVEGFYESVEAIIACWVTFAIMAAVGIPLFVFEQKTRKKVLLWMDDAVLLKAKTIAVDKDLSMGYTYKLGPIFMRTTAIAIKFRYLGKKYRHTSVTKESKGLSYVYNKYVDREIYMLYSPKCDKVLLLKLKKEDEIRNALGED